MGHHNSKIRRIGSAAPRGPQRLVCPSVGCAAEAWYVEADPHRPETWLVAAEPSGSAWVIAAEEPICPRCAATLADRHESALEAGPFSRFIRSLAA